MLKVESEYGTTFMDIVGDMVVVSGRSEDLDGIDGDINDNGEVLQVELSVLEQLGVVGIRGSGAELPPDS